MNAAATQKIYLIAYDSCPLITECGIFESTFIRFGDFEITRQKTIHKSVNDSESALEKCWKKNNGKTLKVFK
jgi:hypothetical protein